MPARCLALRVRCPGPLCSCSPVCLLGVLFGLCGVLGHLAPVHSCARSVCCLCVRSPGPLGFCSPVCPLGLLPVCAVSWATWLLFTGVPACCVVLLVRCPGPLGTFSPVCPLGVLCCLCGVLGHWAPVHRCALLGVLCCVCGVLGHWAPVHRCARSVRCFACAVSWATWLLFTGVPARCVALRVRCPGSLGSCSPVCPLGALLCVCAVLGHLAPVHRCAHSVCCLCVRCPGPLGSCSPVCPVGALFCLCGVLGHLAPVHQCARWVRCFACAVSWATWLLFTSASAWFVVLRVRCPRPLGSCSPVCPLGVLFCLCGVLGHSTPVHRCARSVCGVVCAVSWATWLLFTGVPPRCVDLLVRCPGQLGSCSLVCPPGVLPVCGVSWATWLLFTGVPAWCVVLLVRCPGPVGSCSQVCSLGVLCCVCGVLGHLAPVHWCARSVCCVACVVSWAPWLLFTGALARCAVLCPGPLGSCSPLCSLGVLCCGLCVRGVAAGHSLVTPDGCYLWPAGAGYPPGGHSSVRTVAVRSRQGLGTLRAHTRPSGRRLFRSWQGLGSLQGAHTSGRTAAGVAWHLSLCSGSSRVVRALGVCGTRRPLLSGTVPCALFVADGVPLWGALWPRVVHRASSRLVALSAQVGFPVAVVPFPTPGACAPGFTGWLRGARGGRPRTGLIVLAPGPRRGGGAGLAPCRTRSGPRVGVVPGGSLRRRSWAACAAVVGVCGPVTDASGFPYCLSSDGVLGRCTGAVSCGRRHLPLRVGGRHAQVPCVCACARPSWPGQAGRPPGRVLVRLTFSFKRFVFLLCLPPSGLGLPLSWSFVCPRPPLFCSFFFLFCSFLRCCFPRAPFVSCFLWFPAPGALGLGAVCCLFCWPRASRLSVRSRLFCAARLAVGCSLVLAPPPLWCFAVFVAVTRCLAFFFLLLSAPPLSLAFSGFRPRVP